MQTKRRILDVLMDEQNNPNGWFYLPEPINQWTLETIGIFVDDEYGEEEDQTQQLLDNGWVETLETTMIEDVIDNAKEQKEYLTPEDLFQAFIFFVDNDAFLSFKISK